MPMPAPITAAPPATSRAKTLHTLRTTPSWPDSTAGERSGTDCVRVGWAGHARDHDPATGPCNGGGALPGSHRGANVRTSDSAPLAARTSTSRSESPVADTSRATHDRTGDAPDSLAPARTGALDEDVDTHKTTPARRTTGSALCVDGQDDRGGCFVRESGRRRGRTGTRARQNSNIECNTEPSHTWRIDSRGPARWLSGSTRGSRELPYMCVIERVVDSCSRGIGGEHHRRGRQGRPDRSWVLEVEGRRSREQGGSTRRSRI